MASEYVYHWNRIFGALALLVVILGAGAYGIASLFGSDDHRPESAQPVSLPTAGAVDIGASAPQSTQPVSPAAGEGANVASPFSAGSGQESLPGQASDAEIIRAPDRAQVLVASPESDPPAPFEEDARGIDQPLEVAEAVADNFDSGAPEKGAPALENPVQDPGEDTGEPATPSTAAVPTPAPVLSPGLEQPLLAAADPVPDRDSAPDGRAGQAPTSAEQPGPAQHASLVAFEAGQTRLYSPAVQRFSLAKGVKNREPVGDLQALAFDENGLATAYAFSEVEGLMGSTLYYHWLHEGKKLAAVRIRVADERWRSHSSKYIEAEKTGAWTVQLRSANGELLAQADFTVRREGASAGR